MLDIHYNVKTLMKPKLFKPAHSPIFRLCWDILLCRSTVILHHSPSTPFTIYTIPHLHHSPSTPFPIYTIPHLHHSPSTPFHIYTIPHLHHSPSTPFPSTPFPIYTIPHLHHSTLFYYSPLSSTLHTTYLNPRSIYFVFDIRSYVPPL